MIRTGLLIIGILSLLGCRPGMPWNCPYPHYSFFEHIGYSVFSTPPKTLDSAQAYDTQSNAIAAAGINGVKPAVISYCAYWIRIAFSLTIDAQSADGG